MNLNTVEKIRNSLLQITNQYYKLIYVNEYLHGTTTSYYAKNFEAGYLNLGTELSFALLDIPLQRRPFKVTEIVENLIQKQHNKIICIDRIEVLFEPSLKTNPFQMLKQLSKNHILIVAWRGTVSDQTLIYAKPSHPEYSKYTTTEEWIL